MRSEVKKLLEGASGEELKSYIGQDRSVSLEELQLWMLRVVYVEESGAANGDVIKMATAIHADGYDTTKLIRSLTEQQGRQKGAGAVSPIPRRQVHLPELQVQARA